MDERQVLNDLKIVYDILSKLASDKQYQNDYSSIETLSAEIKIILSKGVQKYITKPNAEEKLQSILDSINLLDQKYIDLFDLVNYYEPVLIECKRAIKKIKVEKLREINREKRKKA